MKIVFNKVTWYSKLAAVFVFFVIVPCVSFYLGSYYEQTKILIKNTPTTYNDVNVKNVQPVLPVNKANIKTPIKPTTNIGIACTMEAKLCPDGSYVGRTGPKCEFTPCP